MRKTVVLLLVTFGIFGGLPPINVAAATVVPFTARMYLCSFEPETDRTSGDKMLHFYNGVNHNLWVASTPLVSGREDNIVDGTVDLATSSGVAHPHGVIRPAAYDGVWEEVVLVTVTPTGLQAHGTARGTGALLGMTMKFHSTGAVFDLPAGVNPCSDTFNFAGLFEGEVLIPAGA
jgi:hypothetical protein